MPLTPSRKAIDTPDATLPRQDTIPMPVTTTRRISESLRRTEQAHTQLAGHVYQTVVDIGATVSDHQRQPAAHHAAHVDLVTYQACILEHLAGELHFADTQRTPTSRFAQPRQEESRQLPHGIQSQASRHHRIAFEMTIEEPQIRPDVLLCMQQAFAERASVLVDACDAIEHQHRWRRQARVVRTEQFTACASEK